MTGPGALITLQRDAGSTDWVGYLAIRVPPGREAHLGLHPSGRGLRWWLLLEARLGSPARGLLGRLQAEGVGLVHVASRAEAEAAWRDGSPETWRPPTVRPTIPTPCLRSPPREREGPALAARSTAAPTSSTAGSRLWLMARAKVA